MVPFGSWYYPLRIPCGSVQLGCADDLEARLAHHTRGRVSGGGALSGHFDEEVRTFRVLPSGTGWSRWQVWILRFHFVVAIRVRGEEARLGIDVGLPLCLILLWGGLALWVGWTGGGGALFVVSFMVLVGGGQALLKVRSALRSM